jgi:5-methylcytosine-specific restriction endonuclease McrA
MVYVIDMNDNPLMPCENVVARLLLKSKKAKVLKKCPFTIKLLNETTSYTQSITLGVDTGSSHIGTSAVTNDGKVLYMSDVIVRNDIKDKMDARRKYRRSRRNRKNRYRKARWLNRKNSIKSGRFSPTMISKINSHIKEIEYAKSILPINNLVLETGTFDMHLMKNPMLHNEKYRHWGYQKGLNYGFANTKAKVLNRDNYTCQCCKGKKKSNRLEIHHVIFRSNGGSDEEDNLITLCDTCHTNLHHGNLKLNIKGIKKGSLKHATQMNSIRIQLLNIYECEETFGYITKENRQNLGLPKEHYMDAVVIASGGEKVNFKQDVLYIKKCVSCGDYQQSKGIRSEQRIPTNKICGFRKFDKVNYFGKEYFIKGRMSSGYAILMDIEGNNIDFSGMSKGFKTPKLSNCKRISARKTWMIMQKNIA